MWHLFEQISSQSHLQASPAFSTATAQKWTHPAGPVGHVQHRGQGTPGSCHIPEAWWTKTRCFFFLSPLNSLGVTTQSFQWDCWVNYKYPQHSMAFGQGLSESLTVPGLFGVLWPWILEDSRSCPHQTPHLTHGEDTETQKGTSQSPPASRRVYWENIFCALTWNTAFKTQEKDVFRKLGDVSNTAHTPALLWQTFPPCQKHQGPLLSC